MSDPSPRLSTVLSATESPVANVVQPPKLGTDLGKTAAPMLSDNIRREFLPSTNAAIFSTELCTRAARAAPGPPYPPVIVRGSDTIKAVVDAASLWQKKFKWQCLCIFPGQKWDVNDLWDAQDLHFDSPSFCQKILTFIERDTYYAAKQFADDWARAHPDRLAFVAGNAMATSDPQRPLDCVDKIFVHGETMSFPRTFLWHVAHMIRTTLTKVSQVKNGSIRSNVLKQPLHVEQQDGAKIASRVTGVHDASTIEKSLLLQNNPAIQNAQSKKIRQRPKHQSSQLTAITEPFSAARSTNSTPNAPHAVLNRSAPKRELGYSRQQPIYLHEPTGYYARDKPSPSMKSSGIHPQGMKQFKGRNRNTSSGSYNQSMSQQEWAENFNRPQGGPRARHISGAASTLQSPHIPPASMVVNQAMMMPPGMIPHYVHGVTMMPTTLPNQHFDAGVPPRGVLLAQAMPLQDLGGQTFLPHPPHPHNIRGVSAGQVTNTVYFPNDPLAQQVDHRGPFGTPRKQLPQQWSAFRSIWWHQSQVQRRNRI